MSYINVSITLCNKYRQSEHYTTLPNNKCYPTYTVQHILYSNY